ncbi:MAG: MurR/RpiR family transcriptional regulator [Anaerolineales bacterium]|nr:MurR/RpiR family transcriptional regulator [Anaerolineales bacterium]
MTYEERIRENRHRMSKSFGRLADYILDSYILAAMMTATELAHQVNVDAATVVRFAQTLGYTGFPELQREIIERVRRDLHISASPKENPETVSEIARNSLFDLGDMVSRVQKTINVDSLHKFINHISKARLIYVLSEPLGQAAAQNLKTVLEEGGFQVALALTGARDLARVIASVTKEDLILVIDITGETEFLSASATQASERGIPTAVIASTPSFESTRSADIVLSAQNQSNSRLNAMVVEALIYTLAETLRWNFKNRFDNLNKQTETILKKIQ